MLLGTEVVLTGAMSWQGLALSVLPFCLANNLLLLNQFPDVEADQSVGRRTLPVLLGRLGSVLVLGLQYGLAFGARCCWGWRWGGGPLRPAWRCWGCRWR